MSALHEILLLCGNTSIQFTSVTVRSQMPAFWKIIVAASALIVVSVMKDAGKVLVAHLDLAVLVAME